MQDYDLGLKLLLQTLAEEVFQEMAGVPVPSWLNIDLPKAKSFRVDLLGETEGAGLLHIELQSTNETNMPLRMAEYALAVMRNYGSDPRQILLYVGAEPLRMKSGMEFTGMTFHYELIDARTLNGERLLKSSRIGDNIFALLTSLSNPQQAVHQVVANIAQLPADQRDSALGVLLLVCGLRQLEQRVEEEARQMPLLNDILDNKVLGREYKKGLEKGREQGLEQGELNLFRRQIIDKFGEIPAWVEQRISNSSAEEIGRLGVRLLHVGSVAELFD